MTLFCNILILYVCDYSYKIMQSVVVSSDGTQCNDIIFIFISDDYVVVLFAQCSVG